MKMPCNWLFFVSLLSLSWLRKVLYSIPVHGGRNGDSLSEEYDKRKGLKTAIIRSLTVRLGTTVGPVGKQNHSNTFPS